MKSLKAGDSAEQAAYVRAGTLAAEVLSSIKTVRIGMPSFVGDSG